MFTMKRIILVLRKIVGIKYQRISIGMDLLQNQIKLREPLLYCLDLHVGMTEVVVLKIKENKYV